MTRLIDAAKAARYLGISRTELQKLIRNGELQNFEGKVDLQQLEKLYPALHAPPPSLLEDTNIIRDSAYARRIQSLFDPSREELESQVKHLRVQLSVERVKARSNQKLVDELLGHIGSLQQTASQEQKQLLQELNQWLREHVQEARNATKK